MFTVIKTILEPNTIPSVAIDFMNQTHSEEVILVKQIGKLVSVYQDNDSHNDDDINAISKSLQEWLEHTQAHFARENDLMQEYGFPVYEIHANEHEIALEKMQTVVNVWHSNNDIERLCIYPLACLV